MQRALSALMAVTAGGATSQVLADPSTIVAAAPRPPQPPQPAVQPRVLPSGAPACGNVMFKSYTPRDQQCGVVLRQPRKLAEALEKLRVRIAALTVERKARPLL